ncbi:PilW family protein [Acinetobacter larvae]|uniref:Prepilin-type N-terminal cleavage/methylation domain-containing protein n=1 Tax=Acinetobacter larvae TaxID=1789224 RepID=A0A1B2LW16_9GAMM|nr:PilW family protein [Acinetobacter larvae]AOA57142.1 hypothetical protein BFG52_01430 [Acinetobacter larvae]
MIWTQYGLSVLEVVISLTLGLLLVGAAFKLLESGERAYSTQQAVADIQDRAILSLAYVATEIRRSHRALAVSIQDQPIYAGLLLNAHAEQHTAQAAQPKVVQTRSFMTAVAMEQTSTFALKSMQPSAREQGVAAAISVASNAQAHYPAQLQGILPITVTAGGPSHLRDTQTGKALASDQLVIQFYAEEAGIDCEGHQYQAGQFVVERFFLRPDALNQQAKQQTVLALACEAGGYDQQATRILKNPMQAGQAFGQGLGAVMIPQVEHFKLMFAIADEQRRQGLAYISSQEYQALPQRPRPAIYAVQLGILLGSNHPITASHNDSPQFQILQQAVQLLAPSNAQQGQQYLYHVLEHSVALEPGLVVIEEKS